MQRYRVNFPLLIGLLLGTVAVAGAGYGIWTMQQSRNAGRVLARAEEAQADGDLAEAAKLYSRYLSLREDDEVMVKLANTYADVAESPDVGAKQIRSALGLLENTVREQPDNATLRRRLVDMLMSDRVRMLKPALDHISQLLNQNPDDAELHVMRSECLFAANDAKAIDHGLQLVGYDETADDFDAQAAKAPDEAAVYLRVAMALRRERNERELADRVIDRMVEVNDDEGTAHLLRAQYKESTGDAEAAEADVVEALRLAPDDPTIVIAATNVEVRKAQALDEEDFDSEEALQAARQVHFDRGRALLLECLEKNPEDPSLYQALATIEIREGDKAEAVATFDRGIEAVPERNAQMLWFTKARIQIELEQYDEARASIAAMREAEVVVEPFIDYLDARLLMTQSEWFAAAKELDRLQAFMAKVPNLASELNYLLGLCYEKLGQFEKALGAYNVSLQRDPLDKAAGFGRTRVLNAMGQASRDADNLTLYALMQDELNKPEDEQDWEAFGLLLDRYVEQLELGDAMRSVLEGEVLMRRGLYNEARVKLKESYKMDPNNLAVRRAAVKLFASDPSQGPVRALRLLDKVVEDFGDMPILRLEKADLLIATNDEDLVDQLFALTQGVDDYEVKQKVQLWSGLSEKFARLSDRESQMVCLQKVVELSPSDLPTLVRLFMMAREAGDEAALEDSQKRILKLVGDKNDPTYQLTVAYRLLADLRRQDVDREAVLAEADRVVDQALSERPEWNQLYLAKANIELLQGDERAALESLDRSAELGRPTTLSLYQHVKLLARRGRFKDALAQMEKVPPAARLALLGRDYAEALFSTRRISDALAAAAKVDEAGAQNAAAKLWYGRFLSKVAQLGGETEERSEKLLERAGEAFQAVVTVDPNSAEGWLALVAHLATSGEKIEAENAIRRAQLVLPEDKTLLMYARCYELVGRLIDAEAHYKQAVEDAEPADKPRATRLLASFYLGPGYPKPNDERVEKATPLINDVLRAVADGEIEPNDVNARWARTTAARILASAGEYQQLRDAERLLASNVVRGELPAADRKLMAEILAARPEPVSRMKAVRLFEGLRDGDRVPLKSELDLARLYFSLGEWRKCKEQMIDIIARFPKDPTPRQLYVRMLVDRGGPTDLSQAVPQLRRLNELAPTAMGTREMIARVAHKQGKRAEASATLRRLLPKDLSTIEERQLPLVRRVAQLLVEFDDIERAKPLMQAAADKGGPAELLRHALFLGSNIDVDQGYALLDEVRGDVSPSQLIKTGSAILRNPVDEEAAAAKLPVLKGWLERGLREDPNSVPLRLARAEVLELGRDYAAAADAYRELLESGELKGIGRAVVLNNLAYLLALTQTDASVVREAQAYVNEAVDLIGPQTDILDTRAVISIAAQDYSGAIEDLKMAVIDKPTASKFFHKATAHLLAGQNSEAEEAWRKAIDLGLTRESVSQLEKDQFDALKNQLDGIGQRSAQL